MKRYITAITIVVVIIAAMLSCAYCASQERGHAIPGNNPFDYQEWVSPDGVHYWRTPYNMAPRYDNNGELVIDGK